MKLLPRKIVTAVLLLAAHATSAQTVADNYEFFYPKIKFESAFPVPEGITYKSGHVQKTDRLSSENLDALAPMVPLDLKYKRKDPDVTFFLTVSGITLKNQETVMEGGKYFRKISYTIQSSIDCIDKNGATFNSLPMEDGTNVKSIKVGSNFFRQTTSYNSKYPKPADIPNIDASPGYVPSFEEAFNKFPAVGFSTTADLDAFLKKYLNFIAAKTEALAVETEFRNSAYMLEVFYSSSNFRVDFGVAKVGKPKSNPYNYDDLNNAAEQIKSAYKILSVNVNDTAAYYPLLRSAVNTYTAVEAANEDRVKTDIAQSIIQHNLCLAHVWLLNIDEAWAYYNKFSANKRAAEGPVSMLQRTITYLSRRAVVKNGKAVNLLEKLPKP